MFYYPVKIDGKPQHIVVRPNNDGYAVWYVVVFIDGEEADDIDDCFGNPDIGFDENPEQFAKDMLAAFEHAKSMVKFLHEQETAA